MRRQEGNKATRHLIFLLFLHGGTGLLLGCGLGENVTKTKKMMLRPRPNELYYKNHEKPHFFH